MQIPCKFPANSCKVNYLFHSDFLLRRVRKSAHPSTQHRADYQALNFADRKAKTWH